MKIANWKSCIRNRTRWKKFVEKAKTFSEVVAPQEEEEKKKKKKKKKKKMKKKKKKYHCENFNLAQGASLNTQLYKCARERTRAESRL